MSEVDVGDGWRLLEVGEQIEEGDEFFFRSGWFPVSPKTDAAVLDGLASRFSVRRRVPAATADARTPVDPGDGWRLLGENERVEAGDEYLDRGVWCGTKCAGRIVKHMDETYRRRVPAATDDARTPTPVAWGVWGRGAVCGTTVSREDAVCMQREFAFDTDIRPLYAAPPALSQPTPEPVAWVATKPGGDGGYQRCIGWDREKVVSGIDQDASSHPISITPLYEHPPTPHPLCRDVDRDLAARVTLPEWRELPGIVATLLNEAVEARKEIAELHELYDAQAKTFGRFYISRDKETSAVCQRLVALEQGPSDGRDPAPRISRIEARVAALESAPKLAPAANADAERRPRLAAAMMPLAMAERDAVDHAADILEEMEDEDGNPLAPKANTLRSLLIRKSNEEKWMRELVKRRDEAIRERDEAREECERIRYALVEQRDAAIRERDEARASSAALSASVPRGWLTDEEHRAVAFAAKAMRGHTITGNLKEIADQLDALLDRPTTPTSEAGTVPVSVRLGGVGHWFVGGETRIISKNGWVTLDLTPAQVRELERQVSGEVGR
jgi:hypothetical protein